jgi:hypothetical protein
MRQKIRAALKKISPAIRLAIPHLPLVATSRSFAV